MSGSRWALPAVGGTVLVWSASSVVIKLASTTGLVTSFYRLWLAVPLLWSSVLLSRSIRARLDRKWLHACLLGGSLFGVHQLLFFNALKLTSVANVTLTGALQPALVLLVAGRLFGEAVTLRGVAWSGVALAGTVVVVSGSVGAPGWSPLGDALAAGNLLAFTAYFLVSKRLRARVAAWEYVVGMTTVAGLVVLAACLWTGQALGSPTGEDWLLLAFLAVLPGTLGHLLMNWAHPHTSAFVVSMLLLAVPVLSSLAAVGVLGEPLGAAKIAGGIVVLVAIGVIVGSAPAPAGGELAGSVAGTDAP